MNRAFLGVALFILAHPLRAQGQTEIVSHVNLSLRVGDLNSYNPEFSTDGRFVVFESFSNNLVPGVAFSQRRVFIVDRMLGTTELVDHGPSGIPANGESWSLQLSGDGRRVLFGSVATDLGGYDNSHGVSEDVFLLDRSNGIYECLSSTPTDGRYRGLGARMSSDARFVAMTLEDTFAPPGSYYTEVWLLDRASGVRTLVSTDANGNPADRDSGAADISDDGRFVSFLSLATNLVPGDTNGLVDVFVKDMLTGAIERVSVSTNGLQANNHSENPRLASNGRVVTFPSRATNLVPGVNLDAVYVRDLVAGTLEVASVSSTGAIANSLSSGASISDDARYVAFQSYASNLQPSDADSADDAFVHDRLTGVTRCVSVETDSAPISAYCRHPVISGNGRVFAFVTRAGPHDQIYAHDPSTGNGSIRCEGTFGACPCGNNGLPNHGCENSFGVGGAGLSWIGNASVAYDTFTLVVEGLPTSASVLFFQGTIAANGGVGTAFGDGLRCAAGVVTRLGIRTANMGASSIGPASGDPELSALGGVVLGGARRVYQAWYRNIETWYCTPSGFNLSNGVEMHWGY